MAFGHRPYRPNPYQRCLNDAHRRKRAALLPLAYGTYCPYYQQDPQCEGLMLTTHALELDHEIPRALGGADGPVRIAHAGCNRRAGARLGRAIQLGTVAKEGIVDDVVDNHSREW